MVMPKGNLSIVPVPAFADNYIWLVHDADSGVTAVVDPGDAAPADAHLPLFDFQGKVACQ
jgi:hydroxyacylglutathione hydrolase